MEQEPTGVTLRVERRAEGRLAGYVWVGNEVGEVPGRDGGKRGVHDDASRVMEQKNEGDEELAARMSGQMRTGTRV